MTTKPIVTANGTSSALNFDYDIFIDKQLSPTSVLLVAGSTAPSYIVTKQKVTSSGANDGAPVVTTVYSNNITMSGLVEGGIYNFSVQPTNGVDTGNTQTIKGFTLTTASANGSVISNALDSKNLNAAKSYFELSYPGTKKNEFAVAHKIFDAITVPSFSLVSGSTLPPYLAERQYAQSESYYTFGTSIFMNSSDVATNNAGGIGFFLDEEARSGYYVFVETTTSSASNDRKSIRIMKATAKGMTELANSQKTAQSTFDGVYGGKAYNIDIKVKVMAETIKITAYINGFKITATDVNNFDNTSNLNFILPPSQIVGIATMKGKILFDYVYGTSITKEKYDSSDYSPNLYLGQFSNDVIDAAYGNILYNANNAQDEIDQYKSKLAVEEFGTVVREIVHVKPRFSARPAFPIKWSTGVNNYVKVIGQKASSFGGEAFVLNNTSMTIPLADNDQASFYIYGNQLGESGELIYSTDQSEEYTTKEPVIFSSSWIQNEGDAKNLAEWIKATVINRGKLVNINVFGNPLISVGDIISVKNTYQGFDGTEKLIVTSVVHTYNEGLDTSITCRTL